MSNMHGPQKLMKITDQEDNANLFSSWPIPLDEGNANFRLF